MRLFCGVSKYGFSLCFQMNEYPSSMHLRPIDKTAGVFLSTTAETSPLRPPRGNCTLFAVVVSPFAVVSVTGEPSPRISAVSSLLSASMPMRLKHDPESRIQIREEPPRVLLGVCTGTALCSSFGYTCLNKSAALNLADLSSLRIILFGSGFAGTIVLGSCGYGSRSTSSPTVYFLTFVAPNFTFL